jgi:hypothetical protein
VPEWWTGGLPAAPESAAIVFGRLVVAMVLGGVVALIYRRTRPRSEVSESFTATLVLLAILIAMVTQVIGDNVARAFSLVGALSIVRFRTVVRDTQDTAYVIFAVAVGMAIGASNIVVAGGGLVVVGVAAMLMRRRPGAPIVAAAEELPFELSARVALGSDADALLGPTLDQHKVSRRLMGVSTARQGLALEVTYRAALGDEGALAAIVSALNRVDGVQAVTLRRVGAGDL